MVKIEQEMILNNSIQIEVNVKNLIVKSTVNFVKTQTTVYFKKEVNPIDFKEGVLLYNN